MIFITEAGLRTFENNSMMAYLDSEIRAFDKPVTLASYTYTYAMVYSEDTLYACGYNHANQFGLPNTQLVVPWTKISFQHQVIMISCGHSHSMIYSVDGLYGCGINHAGQLGLGLIACVQEFTRIEFDRDVKSIHCLNTSTVIHADDGVYTCGINLGSQPEEIQIRVLTRLLIIEPILSVACGADRFAVRVSDGVYLFEGSESILSTSYSSPIKRICSLPLFGIGYVQLGTIWWTADGLYLYSYSEDTGYFGTKISFDHNIVDIACRANNIIIYSDRDIYKINTRDMKPIKVDFGSPIILPNRRLNRTKSARK